MVLLSKGCMSIDAFGTLIGVRIMKVLDFISMFLIIFLVKYVSMKLVKQNGRARKSNGST